MILRCPDPIDASITQLVHLRLREHFGRRVKKIIKAGGNVYGCCEIVLPGNNRESTLTKPQLPEQVLNNENTNRQANM